MKEIDEDQTEKEIGEDQTEKEIPWDQAREGKPNHKSESKPVKNQKSESKPVEKAMTWKIKIKIQAHGESIAEINRCHKIAELME